MFALRNSIKLNAFNYTVVRRNLYQPYVIKFSDLNLDENTKNTIKEFKKALEKNNIKSFDLKVSMNYSQENSDYDGYITYNFDLKPLDKPFGIDVNSESFKELREKLQKGFN